MGRTAVTFSSLRVSVPVLCTHTLGAVVADDVRLMEGEILLDQSMLTGESIPIQAVDAMPFISGMSPSSAKAGNSTNKGHRVTGTDDFSSESTI